MKAELQKQLFDKYPKIFGQKDLPMTQTCMCWGIDCGDGWYWILDMLCGTIQNYCDSRNEGVKIRNKARKKGKKVVTVVGEFKIERGNVAEEYEWQVEATQVKEKFGGLRFYINSGDDMVYGMIELAEHMSYNTCEYCGDIKTAKRKGDGWIFTLCDECWKKKERRNES